MKLTKKFIKENAGMTLKEAFPEVFETKLKVGRWYKLPESDNFLINIVDKKRSLTYGFSHTGKWYGKSEWGISGLTPATNKEVLETLSKEAVKRGFKEGVKVMPLWETPKTHWEVHDNQTRFEKEGNSFYFGCCIFQNGTWAQIIKPKQMTKQEIEKELGYNIEVI